MLRVGCGRRTIMNRICGIYSVQAQALFSVLPPQTPARKALINGTINILLGGGAWPLIDAFWMPWAADRASALVNWKTPGTLTLVEMVGGTPTPGGVTFTVDRGFTGNGADMWLSSGYAFGASSLGISQNSAHIAGVALTNSANTNNDIYGVGTTNRLLLKLRNLTNASVRVSTATTLTASVGATVPYMAAGDRIESTTEYLYFNGGNAESAPAASASIAGGTDFSILGDGSTFSNRQIAMASLGQGLNSTPNAAYYAAMKFYASGVGVTLP